MPTALRPLLAAALCLVSVLAGAPGVRGAPLSAGSAPTLELGEGIGYVEMGTVRADLGVRWGGARAGQWGLWAGLDHRAGRWEVGFEATRPLAHGRRASAFASLLAEATVRGDRPGLALWPGLDLGVGLGAARRVTLDLGVQGMAAVEREQDPLRGAVLGRAGLAFHPARDASLTVRTRMGAQFDAAGAAFTWEIGGALVTRL